MPLQSGAGQGTILGLLLFCVTFNGAGPKPSIENIGSIITQTRRKRQPIKEGKKLWVDDLTVTVPIQLSKNLVKDDRTPQIGPVSYHNRTQHILPRTCNKMQDELDRLNEFCRLSKMSISHEKSKCMIFNRGKKYDFMPQLQLKEHSNMEVVDTMKLVGFQLRSDLKTSTNTQYLVKRAWKKMWVVRRLKALGATEEDMLRVLRTQVLSHLQFASPAWSTLLTGKESSQIESVLKTGLFLVYGSRYESFSWALSESNMSSLRDQRKKIFERFTRNCIKNNKFSKWLVRTDPAEGRTTRLAKPRFKPVPFRTASYARSAIPQMVKLANRLGL